MRDRLNKLKSNLKLLWRKECLVGTCHCISIFCNRFKNVLQETYLQSFWKITAMLVNLAPIISSKYYILLFSLNLIITIIVILLAYSTICSNLVIVLHQAGGEGGGASPYSWLKVYFFQTRGIIRLNRTGISNLNWLFLQEIKSSGPTLGLWKGSQVRIYIYIKGKPFLSKLYVK